MSKLLIIDSRLEEIQTIINSLNTSSKYILLDYYNDTFNDLLNKISALNESTFTNVALMAHSYSNKITYKMLDKQQTESILYDVQTLDSNLSTWLEIINFWNTLVSLYSVQFIDYLGCAILNDPYWSYVIFDQLDGLDTHSAARFRASNNNTGNTEGSDWILESDHVNVKDIYFTDSILGWDHNLFIPPGYFVTNHDFTKTINGPIFSFGHSQFSNINYDRDQRNILSNETFTSIIQSHQAFAALTTTGNVICWGQQSSGGNINYPNYNEDKLINVKEIVSTQYAFAALKYDGSVVAWGNPTNGGNIYYPSDVSQDLTSNVIKIYACGTDFAALKADGNIICWGSLYMQQSVNWNSSIQNRLKGNVLTIKGTDKAFAALCIDGSIVAWGGSASGLYGGNITKIGTTSSTTRNNGNLTSNVVDLYAGLTYFIARKNDGSLWYWGGTAVAGQKASPNASIFANISGNIIDVFCLPDAVSVLKIDGNIYSWGTSNLGGNSASAQVNGNVIQIYKTLSTAGGSYSAFVGLRNDGTVTAWSRETDLNSFNIVANNISIPFKPLVNIQNIYMGIQSAAAIQNDGNLTMWGRATYGGVPQGFDTLTGRILANSNSVESVYHTIGGYFAANTTGYLCGFGDTQPLNTQASSRPFINANIIYAQATAGTGMLSGIRSNLANVSISSLSYLSDADKIMMLKNNKLTRRKIADSSFNITGSKLINRYLTEGATYKVLNYTSGNLILGSDVIHNTIVPVDDGENVTIEGRIFTSYGNRVYEKVDGILQLVTYDNNKTPVTIGSYTVRFLPGSLIIELEDTSTSPPPPSPPVNNAPTDISLSSSTVAENQSPGTLVGTLSTTDPDAANTFTYSLVSGTGSTDNASFSISSEQLLTAATFNYETKSSYSIRIRSTDQDGSYYEKQFTITVTNVNETPTDISLSSSTVAENQSPGTLVGTLSTTDPDAANTFTYSLVSGTGDADNASFSISSNQLLTATTFNYDTKSSYSIRIRSTDQDGLYYEKQFTITATNVNETPTDISLYPSSIAENAPIGTHIGIFSTTDPDSANTFICSLVSGTGDTDNASFTLSSNRLFTATALNHATKSSYSIRVRSTDQGGLYYEKQFTITVIDLNETPTDITLSSSTIAENNSVNYVIGTLLTTDPDAANTFTYSLVSGTGSTDNASFNINGSQLRASEIFNYKTKSSYSIRIRSTDQDGLYYEKQFTIAVTDVNETQANGSLTDLNNINYTLTINNNTYNIYGNVIPSLSGQSFVSENLGSVNLYNTNLTNVNFSSANLISANLSYANLVGANLISANLISANLVGANLYNVNLSSTILTNANLTSANLTNVNLSGLILSGTILTNANLTSANLINVNLSGSSMTGAILSNISGSPTLPSNFVQIDTNIYQAVSGGNYTNLSLSNLGLIVKSSGLINNDTITMNDPESAQNVVVTVKKLDSVQNITIPGGNATIISPNINNVYTIGTITTGTLQGEYSFVCKVFNKITGFPVDLGTEPITLTLPPTFSPYKNIYAYLYGTTPTLLSSGSRNAPTDNFVITLPAQAGGYLTTNGTFPSGAHGDPHIFTINGERYDLPYDQESYLLFDNKSPNKEERVIISCKNWFLPEYIKNNSPFVNMLMEQTTYMKYLNIQYNDIQLILDMETLNPVHYTNENDVNTYTLRETVFRNTSNFILSDKYSNKYAFKKYYIISKEYIHNIKYNGISRNITIITNNNKYELTLSLDLGCADERNEVIFKCQKLNNDIGAFVNRKTAYRLKALHFNYFHL
jgi:uncharacterized protein YjbI with pentapeptide repeats